MRIDLEYGDIIYRKRNDALYFYIFIKYVVTFEQSLPQYNVVCIPLFRTKNLEDYKKKLEYIFTRKARHARVKVSPVGWKKTSDNVKGYLVKNQLVDNLHLWYNTNVFLETKNKSEISDCDEKNFYLQFKNQLDNHALFVLKDYYHFRVYQNARIVVLGIKREDYAKVLQCMKQEKELQFGNAFKRLNVRVGYYNSKTDMVEETYYNDLVDKLFYLYEDDRDDTRFKYCRDFYVSNTYKKLIKTEYVRIDSIRFKG